MEKILVTIYVLALEEEYDIFLPIGLDMKSALELIQKTIQEMSENNYEISSNVVLYSEDGGKLINTENIVKFSGLKNGCKVLLK